MSESAFPVLPAPLGAEIKAQHPADLLENRVRARVGRARRRAGTVFLSLCFFYMLTSPFYLWQSGLPQISDIVMVFVIGSLFPQGLRFIFHQSLRRVFIWLVAFVAHVTVVSLSWFVIYPADEFLFGPIFYLFNLAVFTSCFGAFARLGDQFLRVLAWGAVVSVIVQTLLSPFFVNFGAYGRQVLFFNNPNQLGYYALICGSIIALAYRSNHITNWGAAVGGFCCVWLTSLSLSKAAMVGIVVLIAITAVGRARWLIVVAVGFLLWAIPADSVIVSSIGRRFDTVQTDSDNTLEGRGYARIWDNPQYLVFGAAEGGYDRLKLPPHGNHEIHSSLATVLFSYGAVGLALFLTFLGTIVSTAGIHNAMYVLPTMLYGLSHMGLRESLFWLFLAQLCMRTDRRAA